MIVARASLPGFKTTILNFGEDQCSSNTGAMGRFVRRDATSLVMVFPVVSDRRIGVALCETETHYAHSSARASSATPKNWHYGCIIYGDQPEGDLPVSPCEKTAPAYPLLATQLFQLPL